MDFRLPKRFATATAKGLVLARGHQTYAMPTLSNAMSERLCYSNNLHNSEPGCLPVCLVCTYGCLLRIQWLRRTSTQMYGPKYGIYKSLVCIRLPLCVCYAFTGLSAMLSHFGSWP